MKEYTIIKNDYFEILIPLSLKKYGDEVLKYSTDKLQEFLSFFKEKSYNKKNKGAFLINHDDFIARIKEVSFQVYHYIQNGLGVAFMALKHKYYLMKIIFMKVLILLHMKVFIYYFLNSFMKKIILIELSGLMNHLQVILMVQQMN